MCSRMYEQWERDEERDEERITKTGRPRKYSYYSLQEIADSVGLSAGTVFYYFNPRTKKEKRQSELTKRLEEFFINHNINLEKRYEVYGKFKLREIAQECKVAISTVFFFINARNSKKVKKINKEKIETFLKGSNPSDNI